LLSMDVMFFGTPGFGLSPRVLVGFKL
jgi:hypothetical protein